MLPINLADYFYRQIRRTEEHADRMYEAVIGVVVDNKDPDKLARVKVKFPSLGGEDTSWWAPLSALGAGKERGWFFLPEIDDEVLVLFEHGDIRRPVVIGALWNGKDAPPDTNGGGNERKTIVSREGSKIVFDDDQGTITLESGPGKIVLSKDNKITMEAAQGDICMQAPQGELTIVANEATFEAQMNCHLESMSGLNVESSANVEIKGGSMLALQGATTNLNPSGGGPSAEEASASPEEVPDPVGG
jgi:uncharacterized protein involved in type VI secretion and phage assembly